MIDILLIVTMVVSIHKNQYRSSPPNFVQIGTDFPRQYKMALENEAKSLAGGFIEVSLWDQAEGSSNWADAPVFGISIWH